MDDSNVESIILSAEQCLHRRNDNRLNMRRINMGYILTILVGLLITIIMILDGNLAGIVISLMATLGVLLLEAVIEYADEHHDNGGLGL